jgi:hypothetical protein
MGKDRGAKRQKKLAKQKAKRQAKRSFLAQRSSKDPTIRLQRTEKWPVIEARVSEEIWEEGIGYLVIAREEPEGGTVFASFLVDVLCLGVKDAFWRAGTREDYREIVRHMEEMQKLVPIKPACLVKILQGAVEFAGSFGFPPHSDFRHASLLLAGIDPSACTEEFEFGEDGRPYYFRGPNETLAQAGAIAERVQAAGGRFTIGGPDVGAMEMEGLEDDLDEDDGPEETGWKWRGPGR